MSGKEQVSAFIKSSFRSVWSLEVLLLLKKERREWAHCEILTALRASEVIVAQSLHALAAAGLVTIDEKGSASYLPVSDEVASLVEEAAELYARKPDAVRRLIVGSSTRGIAAFADAFKLRND